MRIPFQFNIPEFLLPLGISFYTLQAISYLVDIYRGTVQAEKNLGIVALYMSFFPQIMEGPICRYGETAGQLRLGKPITYHNMTRGCQRIIYGVFKKLVIADHLAAVIERANLSITWDGVCDGGTVFLIMLGYTCQLYMDFSGTMDMALGTAEIFDIHLPENFQQPFFSCSISEFWRRWHITLGTWFRDYIFFPVSVSKALKKRFSAIKEKVGNRVVSKLSASFALLLVWLCNGLWHGDGWKYIFFGIYHFVLIFSGVLLEPIIIKYSEKFHISRNSWIYHLMQQVRTFVLVCIGELIFWAKDVHTAFMMLSSICKPWTRSIFDQESLTLWNLNVRKLIMLIFAVLVVFLISVLQERKIDVREAIAKQNIVIRWSIYYIFIFAILIFGAFGFGYIPIDPLYARF